MLQLRFPGGEGPGGGLFCSSTGVVELTVWSCSCNRPAVERTKWVVKGKLVCGGHRELELRESSRCVVI